MLKRKSKRKSRRGVPPGSKVATPQAIQHHFERARIAEAAQRSDSGLTHMFAFPAPGDVE